MPTPTDDLAGRHASYSKYVNDWRLWVASYEGVSELIKQPNMFPQHARETEGNFDARQNTAQGFNYSRMIVDLLTQFLQSKPTTRIWGELEGDGMFTNFLADCDLYGTDYRAYIQERIRDASITGWIGVLVDKPASYATNQAEEAEHGLYPYLAAYWPQNVLNWRWLRDVDTGRPYLDMIVLQDDDRRLRYWTRDLWAVFEPKNTKQGGDSTTSGRTGKENLQAGRRPWPASLTETNSFALISTGENPLGEVPFVWWLNVPGVTERLMGQSDIRDIARLDAGIVRDLSDGQEVINYAAFPQLRMPKRRPGVAGGEDTNPEQPVGARAILDFDPEDGEHGKPDWLPAEVLEPIEAILKWVDRKEKAIYRMAHASGVILAERSEIPSGVALRLVFQQLDSRLATKAARAEEAERQILSLWQRWQGSSASIEIAYPRSFATEDITSDLQNMLVSQNLVKSETFNKQMQERIAYKLLPSVDPVTHKKIAEEIRASRYDPDALLTAPPPNAL